MKIKTIYFFLFVLLVSVNCSSNNSEIERYYIVSRYNIENSAIDSTCALSIGNGEFIFTANEPSPAGYAFNTPQKHTTKILSDTNNLAIFRRNQDNYNVIVWRNDADLKEAARNLYYLEPNHADSVYSFSCQFLNNPENGRIQNFGETEAASKKSWEKFWTTSSAVDFQEYNDPKSKELEERIILSRYLAKIQCCGFLLQAGADISYNNWFGKFHLEMHWWLPYHTILLNGI